MAPDGPNMIEQYAHLIALLSPSLRVVCFDMPGFGFSVPALRYTHALDEGAQVILDLLDGLSIERATLAFSCANGLYAVNAARMAPDRIAGLVLSQTPSLASMQAWVDRTIPRPLRVPVAGQALAWLFRKKLVKSWYPMALPKGRKYAFSETALEGMHGGACFCLAGVVQGLNGETMPQANGLEIPCTMIWGAGDPSHAQTDPGSLRECVPHAEIEIFADCGHFPDLEAPERFAALLVQRVVRQAAGAATPSASP